jgi:hypothetical protein
MPWTSFGQCGKGEGLLSSEKGSVGCVPTVTSRGDGVELELKAAGGEGGLGGVGGKTPSHFVDQYGANERRC